MFQGNSALVVRPAASNVAVIFHGSSPRRVAFHVTDSMPMPDSASARSTTSAVVRPRLSFRGRHGEELLDGVLLLDLDGGRETPHQRLAETVSFRHPRGIRAGRISA